MERLSSLNFWILSNPYPLIFFRKQLPEWSEGVSPNLPVNTAHPLQNEWPNERKSWRNDCTE